MLTENLKMQRARKYRFIFVAFLIMAILFYSSSQPYEEQSLVSVIDLWFPSQPGRAFLSLIQFNYGGHEVSIAANGYGKFIEFFLRKMAHFTSFLCLGLAFLFACIDIKGRTRRYSAGIAWSFTTLYAIFDELHQGITPGRTPLLEDVILDSVGALCGIVICCLFFIRRDRIFMKAPEKT